MRKTAPKTRGSVILMSIGLLTVIAMLGATFLVIAHMDRKQNRALANAAPITMRSVARNELTRICADRLADLHIGANGPYSNASDANETIDYPHENTDPALASIEPYDDSGTLRWLHISNTGVLDPNDVVNVRVDANDLVDTDGQGYNVSGTDYYGDSLPWDTGIRDSENRQYYVAVRLIDASGLINVNTADKPDNAAADTPMPVTNVSLAALLDDPNACDRIHNLRSSLDPNAGLAISDYNEQYVIRPLNPVRSANTSPPPPAYESPLPFGMPDLLAMAWRDSLPNTACDRLYNTLTDDTVCAYLTTWSAACDYPRVSTGTLQHRVNPNTATFDELNAAFLDITTRMTDVWATPDAQKTAAAQLAVNVIDYVDTTNDVTALEVPGVSGTYVYGIERQPFITECWQRKEWLPEGDPMGAVQQMSAIELWNPYASVISLSGLQIEISGTPANIASLPATLDPDARIVIVSDPNDIRTAPGTAYVHNNLNLDNTCKILMPTTGTKAVVIGTAATMDLADPNESDLDPLFKTLKRDDDPGRAKYAVAEYHEDTSVTYCIDDATCPDEASTNLGRANGLGPGDIPDVAPTPVYVRNGDMINLGDLLRVFYVGPTDTQPLDVTLLADPNTADSVFNGKLNTMGEVATSTALIPALPPACMLSDYFNVLTPSSANTGGEFTIYGQVNINTAPAAVLACLPGLAATTDPNAVIDAIIAYRDDPAGAGNRPSITDLRTAPGFASSGEIAIPIRTILTPTSPHSWDGNAANPYDIADSGASDDGLTHVEGDASKYELNYAWLSNQVTVRSDVYIAYIWVAVVDDGDTPDPNATMGVERYLAVIDRSNCSADGDVPQVLLFTRIK